MQSSQTSLETPQNNSLIQGFNSSELCGQATRTQKPFTIWWSTPGSRSLKKWPSISKSCKRKCMNSWKRSVSSSADSSFSMILSSSNFWRWRTQVRILVCMSILYLSVPKIYTFSQQTKSSCRKMKEQAVVQMMQLRATRSLRKKIQSWVAMKILSTRENQLWVNRALKIVKWESKE